MYLYKSGKCVSSGYQKNQQKEMPCLPRNAVLFTGGGEVMCEWLQNIWLYTSLFFSDLYQNCVRPKQ